MDYNNQLSKLSIVACLLLLILVDSNAHDANDSIRSIRFMKVKGDIQIDGRLNEPEWMQSDSVDIFYNHFPDDKGIAENRTVARVLFNDQYLYVSAVCFFQSGYRPIVQSLKRDNPWWFSDSFSLIIDGIGNRANGMIFNVNAGGAQVDGTIDTQGSFTSFDTNWDTQWSSEVSITGNSWAVEIAIPFRMLRYKDDVDVWLVNFVRFDMQRNMSVTWNSIPVNFDDYNLLWTGRAHWDTPPPPFKTNVFISPFIIGKSTRDEGKEMFSQELDGGVDGKIPMSSSLNFDFTINPDFSQVNVDNQVINLTRFDLFYPERRTFFLENSGLFANFGCAPIRPFFSRRMGLKDGMPAPLLGGVRLSGNANADLRIGLMNVVEQEIKDSIYHNYTVGVFQQRVLKNSLIQGIFTNIETLDKHEINEFDSNRSGGLEFKYLSNNNAWTVIGRYHKAFRDDITRNDQYLHFGLTYNEKKWYIDFNALQLQKNYVNDLGFTPRLYQYDPNTNQTNRIGYSENFTEIYYRIFSTASSKVAFHGPKFTADSYFDMNNKLNEADVILLYEFNYKSQSLLNFGVRNNYVSLYYPLHLVGQKFDPIPVRSYKFSDVEFNYESRPDAIFTYSISSAYGTFYNGNKFTAGPAIKLRKQPWGNFRLYYNYNSLKFPYPYGEKEFHLIGSSIELMLSNKLFWTTFFQYNTQIENLNINSRLQWRFRPLSDLFVVYTDNYTSDFRGKSRGIVLKFIYWLNLRKRFFQ